MRLYTKYKPMQPRVKTRRGFYGLLVASVLVFVGAWWWQGRRSQPNQPAARQPSPPSTSRPTPPGAPRPVVGSTESRPISTTLPARASNEVRLASPPIQPATNAAAAESPFVPRPAQNVFEAQLVLARQGISSGSLDGVLGSQTRSALRAYQRQQQLPATGDLDPATKSRLLLAEPPFTEYTITTNDLDRLEPVRPSWLGKSEQDRLDYETILELVAEKAEAHPHFIQRLNPAIRWTNVSAGTQVRIPNATRPTVHERAAFVRIELSSKTLEAFDANTNLLAHFPCSIARFVEKRPVGELHVVAVASNPVYIFDPENFPESEEGRQLGRKLVLPPGPNNPVGTAWISLDRPGYGIHGTPKPEDVGRTESHGCFRLANWNAEFLLQLVRIGMPVYVEP